MYLISDSSKDHRHHKTTQGAYEWWYFDALDEMSNLGIVIIFYDGLLFSPDYHQAQIDGNMATPDYHPGISISLYEGNKTLFYALKSYQKENAYFNDSRCELNIGSNSLHLVDENEYLEYIITIDERLPNGLNLNGTIRFSSQKTPSLGVIEDQDLSHQWNLVQAKSSVVGEFSLQESSITSRSITINGTGYHDHNLGAQPIESDFDQWYWGRIHLKESTLIWYIMYHGTDVQKVAWLINEEDGRISHVESIKMSKQPRYNLFGLKVHHEIEVTIEGQIYIIKTNYIWDQGPFYLRYKVQLYDQQGRVVDGALPGIAEYIKPDRISKKWVKPMIKTRYYREGTTANWIQKSLMLSKWTW
jgi:carotenoid 1,2-hydratase